jgi:hypothetical protein
MQAADAVLLIAPLLPCLCLFDDQHNAGLLVHVRNDRRLQSTEQLTLVAFMDENTCAGSPVPAVGSTQCSGTAIALRNARRQDA